MDTFVMSNIHLFYLLRFSHINIIRLRFSCSLQLLHFHASHEITANTDSVSVPIILYRQYHIIVFSLIFDVCI